MKNAKTMKSTKAEKSSFSKSEMKYVDFVKRNSPMYQNLVALNRKYNFVKIDVPNYREICNTLREYNKIDEKAYLKNKIECRV